MRSPILLALSIALLACVAPEPAAAPPQQAPAAPPVAVDLAPPLEPPAPSKPERAPAAATGTAPPDPHLSREAALREGASFGLIGVIPADGAGDGASLTRGPRVRSSAIRVSGQLAPEIVHRVVGTGFGRFRSCYESGLRDNPNLQGKVSLQLVIDTNGSVTEAADGDSDLPHRGVVECMVRAARSLSFPKPGLGRVTVLYPIVLDPGDP